MSIIDIRRFRLGVEVGKLLDVQLSVAVFVEFLQQLADLAGREVERRTLKDACRLIQSDVAIAVTVVLLEPRHHLYLAVQSHTSIQSPSQHVVPHLAKCECADDLPGQTL